MYIHLSQKIQENDINNELIMEKYEYGIQPLQLFDEKFPEIINKSIIYESIISYNIKHFKDEHIEIKNDKRMCFKCQSSNNINQDYIKIIHDYKNKKKEKKMDINRFYKRR